MKEVYIVDGVRTAIGRFAGALSTVRADDLASACISALVERNKHLDTKAIEDVILGCANQAGEDNRNVARMASLLAGLPIEVGGETVNRLCASGMAAVINAHRAIKDGAGDIYIAGGVENMTRGPWVISKTSQPFGRDAKMYDSSFGWRFIHPKMEELYGTDSMGNTAENLARLYNISREDQDKFALWSQQKASIARKKGVFSEEIIPITVQPSAKKKAVIFDEDEFIRENSSIEDLEKLKPAFLKNGTVTAGNSSGLNDGAATVLLAAENVIDDYKLQPIARIVAGASAGVEPRIMGVGSIYATQKVLKRSNLSIDKMDIIEINEAFAAQVLACTRKLNIEDTDPRINPNGGAIALGHPLGMSGTRILLSAAKQLQRTNKKYALVTMCVGVGQGYAVIIENATK